MLKTCLMAWGVWGFLALSAGAAQAASAVELSAFAAPSDTLPAPWQPVQVSAKLAPTQYRIIEWDGHFAIEAISNASMSLLARPLAIDLNQTPVLCWRWRIDAPLEKADMRLRAGDDYAARVYISFRMDHLSLATRMTLKMGRSIFGDALPDAAISYVWDNRLPIGTQAPNAYTDRTRMIVLQSGAARTGQWVSERRNVLADARAAFEAKEAAKIIAATQLAVASDTDNTGESARAGFAVFHFVAENDACKF
jgi:hypothetical protein